MTTTQRAVEALRSATRIDTRSSRTDDDEDADADQEDDLLLSADDDSTMQPIVFSPPPALASINATADPGAAPSHHHPHSINVISAAPAPAPTPAKLSSTNPIEIAADDSSSTRFCLMFGLGLLIGVIVIQLFIVFIAGLQSSSFPPASFPSESSSSSPDSSPLSSWLSLLLLSSSSSSPPRDDDDGWRDWVLTTDEVIHQGGDPLQQRQCELEEEHTQQQEVLVAWNGQPPITLQEHPNHEKDLDDNDDDDDDDEEEEEEKVEAPAQLMPVIPKFDLVHDGQCAVWDACPNRTQLPPQTSAVMSRTTLRWLRWEPRPDDSGEQTTAADAVVSAYRDATVINIVPDAIDRDSTPDYSSVFLCDHPYWFRIDSYTDNRQPKKQGGDEYLVQFTGPHLLTALITDLRNGSYVVGPFVLHLPGLYHVKIRLEWSQCLATTHCLAQAQPPKRLQLVGGATWLIQVADPEASSLIRSTGGDTIAVRNLLHRWHKSHPNHYNFHDPRWQNEK